MPRQRPPAPGGQGQRPLRRLLPRGGGGGVAHARVLTAPNVISLARLLAIPVFLWLLLGRRALVPAAWLLAGIGATDWIDGFLARRLDQVTELGKLLDPLADRVAVAAAVLAGWAVGALPTALVALLVLREASVGVGMAWVARRRLPKIEVRPLGKAGTMLLYAAIPAFYLTAGGVGGTLLLALAWVLGVLGTVLYYAVAVQYVGDIRSRLEGYPPGGGGSGT